MTRLSTLWSAVCLYMDFDLCSKQWVETKSSVENPAFAFDAYVAQIERDEVRGYCYDFIYQAVLEAQEEANLMNNEQICSAKYDYFYAKYGFLAINQLKIEMDYPVCEQVYGNYTVTEKEAENGEVMAMKALRNLQDEMAAMFGVSFTEADTMEDSMAQIKAQLMILAKKMPDNDQEKLPELTEAERKEQRKAALNNKLAGLESEAEAARIVYKRWVKKSEQKFSQFIGNKVEETKKVWKKLNEKIDVIKLELFELDI